MEDFSSEVSPRKGCSKAAVFLSIGSLFADSC
jgi:hypothetical protein